MKRATVATMLIVFLMLNYKGTYASVLMATVETVTAVQTQANVRITQQ